jgi:sugar/nucleoside kinase (ribokinase family)
MSGEQQLDVLTIGHALVDVQSVADDAFLQTNDIVKGAMQLIEDRRAIELYGKMGPATETSGGSAANTAVGVVSCGGRAAYIGTVAEDELGEIFRHDIRAAGVQFDTPPVPGRVQTGRSFIIVTPDGERSMNTNIGVSEKVSKPHFDVALLRSARVTYVEGYLFDDGHQLDTWSELIDTVRRAGNHFAITLSDSFCVDRHRKLFLSLLDGSVDVCFGNEEEVCALFETDKVEVALDELAKRVEVGAVTRGSRGSTLVCGRTRVDVPAVEVDVVDTTGAGDLYAAGVLLGVARDWDLERCGHMGSAAAAAILGQMGARPTAPIPQVD